MYFTYVGSIYNNVVQLDRMCDLSFYPVGIRYPFAHTVFLTGCNHNFSYFELVRRNFPRLQNIWLISRCDVNVFDRFGSDASFYYCDEIAKKEYPASYQDKRSWLYRSATLVKRDVMEKELHSYYTEPAEISHEDYKLSRKLVNNSLKVGSIKKEEMVRDLLKLSAERD